MASPSTLCLAMIVFVSFLSIKVRGGVEVEGRFTSSLFRNGSPFIQSERVFALYFDEDKWIIRTGFAFPTNGVKYFEMSSDWTNFYRLTYFDTSIAVSNYARKRQIAAQTNAALRDVMNATEPNFTAPQNDSSGWVHFGQIPRYDSSYINPIWLAFCSGRYYATNSSGRSYPMWDMTIPENQRSELPVSARCILFQDAWRLPESIAFWNEGKIEVDRMVSKPNPRQSTNTSGGSFAVVSAIADAYPPYNQGFTNATYEVVSTTNVEGNTLPTHFKITKFSLKKNAKSNADLSIAAVVEAWVTNLTSNVKRSGIQPALSTKTRVVDQRVTQHGNISAQYQATGQKWLTLEESKSLPSVLESLRRAKARKSKLALIFLAFALISAAPIVMLLRKRRGNATE